MTTPTLPTFDLTPPRRPGLDDVGGGAKVDDSEFPPDPIEMPTADDDNQHQNLLVRYGGVVPIAILSVHYTTGTPAINKVVSCVAAAIVPGFFTLTDTGTGNCLVAWAANSLPTPVIDHDAKAVGATPGFATAETLTNSARVRVSNAAGALADINFNLYLY